MPVSQLLMGLDHPFMPAWTFQPAIDAAARWDGFGDGDLTAVVHGNAAQLYPALARRMG
ncbi:hypothetical protein MNJPNG_08930 [Cupriavidus oxalaticus]